MIQSRISNSRTHANQTKTPSAAIAKQNISNEKIKHKKVIITTFINNGIPYLRDSGGKHITNDKGQRLLDYFPTSLSAISSWTSKNHCEYNVKEVKGISELETFDRNKVSDRTRKGTARLQESLQSLVDKLKERASLQTDNEKTSLSDKLKAENKILELQNSALKKTFMEDRKYSDEITAKLNKLTENFANIESELRNNNVELSKKNAELNLEISILTKTINKVTPLKNIR